MLKDGNLVLPFELDMVPLVFKGHPNSRDGFGSEESDYLHITGVNVLGGTDEAEYKEVIDIKGVGGGCLEVTKASIKGIKSKYRLRDEPQIRIFFGSENTLLEHSITISHHKGRVFIDVETVLDEDQVNKKNFEHAMSKSD